MIKTLKYLIIAIVALVFGITSGIGYWIMSCEKYLENTRVTMDVKVTPEQGFNGLYRVLFKDREKPKYFWKYLVKVKKYDTQLRPGYYRANNLSLAELFDIIKEGKQFTIKLTFPEGYNIYDIAKKIENSELENAGDFLELCKDRDLIKTLTGFDKPTIEGFLYPDTYFFPPDITGINIIKRMHGNFMKNLPADFNKKVRQFGLDPYEAVTLASIVQKETYNSEEAPVVASVFYNRLRIRMRLQADPTVIYGKYENFDGDIRFRDLRDKSNPYNTYKHGGLTPTPISNPSKIALDAVANPADTKYLYFVANDKGEHVFSKSYREHTNYVNKFQKTRRKLD